MKTAITVLTTGLMLFSLNSCKENSTSSPDNAALSFSFQSSHCLGAALSKVIALDSSFVYSFAEILVVDFAVPGNCCPDSDRFDVSHSLDGDTLLISVTDTADYGCRCTCNYFIHAEISDLTKDHYAIRCQLTNIRAPYLSQDPLYVVDVYRTRL
jgi:hypothetical protein